MDKLQLRLALRFAAARCDEVMGVSFQSLYQLCKFNVTWLHSSDLVFSAR